MDEAKQSRILRISFHVKVHLNCRYLFSHWKMFLLHIFLKKDSVFPYIFVPFVVLYIHIYNTKMCITQTIYKVAVYKINANLFAIATKLRPYAQPMWKTCWMHVCLILRNGFCVLSVVCVCVCLLARCARMLFVEIAILSFRFLSLSFRIKNSTKIFAENWQRTFSSEINVIWFSSVYFCCWCCRIRTVR